MDIMWYAVCIIEHDKEVKLMAVVKINVNTDDATKKAAESLFSELGLNMTTAINIFLKKALQYRGIPFDVCVEIPNDVTRAALEEGDRILADRSRKRYANVSELKRALEE